MSIAEAFSFRAHTDRQTNYKEDAADEPSHAWVDNNGGQSVYLVVDVGEVFGPLL